jgi:toxin ParE1/3/4
MPLARQDLEDIWDYLAPRNRSAAIALFEGIAKKLRTLQDFPETGAVRGSRAAPYRALFSGRYVILYRTKDGLVTVLRIVHGARNLKRLPGD